jgi:2-oxoglutarate dehydrogenase complex dihydrolipoamide succinyltransferase (E2) component
MARTEVIMPQMGESIAEGTIVKWHKKPGETVRKDEVLLEISTDKVDSEIPSPASGVLAEILVQEQQTVGVRTVIAYIETEGGVAAVPSPPTPIPASSGTTSAPRVTAPAQPAAAPRPAAGSLVSGDRFYSPLVLNIARTEGVSMAELEQIPGTGEGGRVSKKDILGYLARRKGQPAPAAPAQSAARLAAPAGLKSEVVPMSNVMQRMAQHMLHSIQTSPHVSAVHEVDMTAVSRHRAGQAEAFERSEGFKLTFMPYIVDAVVRAIKKYPLINSSIDGTNIIRKSNINIGIAVASESGLIVPVIKHAEEKNFVGLARAINDLAVRTRTKKLTPDDIQGGTFTISNFGVFGTLIGTPIISQPQVAILGTGAITKRPVVIDDAIAIRSMAFFTLSFDHRLVDGALGGMFLEEIVKALEEGRA